MVLGPGMNTNRSTFCRSFNISDPNQARHAVEAVFFLGHSLTKDPMTKFFSDFDHNYRYNVVLKSHRYYLNNFGTFRTCIRNVSKTTAQKKISVYRVHNFDTFLYLSYLRLFSKCFLQNRTAKNSSNFDEPIFARGKY